MTRRKVGILIFPEVEVLDFCGPFEVFSVTRLGGGIGSLRPPAAEDGQRRCRYLLPLPRIHGGHRRTGLFTPASSHR
jgi:hypothetical protein